MTAKQMSEPQVARFTRSMNEQGVGVLRTKKGLLLRLPDGSSTSVHFTNSDVRSFDNLLARLRRAGVRHPEDPKNVAQLPTQITEGTVAERTKQKVLDAMRQMNYPDSVRVQEIRLATGLEHITASKALYALGFRPVVGKRNSRDWMTPGELLDKRVPDTDEESPTIQESDEDDEPAAIVPDVSRETEPEVKVEGTREFIDSNDSWVVDMTKVPKAVRLYMSGLAAAGLHAEIRVWRA